MYCHSIWFLLRRFILYIYTCVYIYIYSKRLSSLWHVCVPMCAHACPTAMADRITVCDERLALAASPGPIGAHSCDELAKGIGEERKRRRRRNREEADEEVHHS